MSPPAIIPDFLVEELEQLDESALLAVALYAESDGVPSDRVPENVSMAFAMQDDETVSAIGRYARELAESSQSAETETPSEEPSETAEDKSTEHDSGLFRDGW